MITPVGARTGARSVVASVLALVVLPWAMLTAGAGFAQDCGWDGSPFSDGPNGPVTALASFDAGTGAQLFAGGTFGSAGVATVANVAVWNGSSWGPIMQGLNGPVAAMLAFDDGGGDDLYVGGDFDTAGGAVFPDSIARWNGTSWETVGVGLPGGVLALTAYDDGLGSRLVAAGSFTTVIDGAPADRIARWSGSSWMAFPAAPGGDVLALAAVDFGSGQVLAAGGTFATVGGTTTNNIAIFNGTTWLSLGAGTNGTVRACQAFDDGSGMQLYIGGDFSIVDGLSVNGIARWNGTSWSTVGTGVSANVHALSVYDDGSGAALYVGGDFASASGVTAPGIARWRSGVWEPLGSGVTGPVVSAFAAHAGVGEAALYVGGTLTAGGLAPATNVAAWGGVEPPSIVSDLAPMDLCAGTPLSLSVGVAGATPYSYEWYLDGGLVSTDPVFELASTPVGITGDFHVVVTNPCGQVSSSTVGIFVEAAPDVSAIANVAVCPGDPASFAATVSGLGVVTMQWRLDGVDIGGATTASYDVIAAGAADAGLYELVVTDDCNTTTVGATLTVYEPVQISSQIVSTTACPDAPAAFTVVATGSPEPTYAWYLDGALIPGATEATYSILQAGVADVGAYVVDVANACGTVSSVQAQLQLLEAPLVTMQPVGASLCLGDGATLDVVATGTPPLSYQWYLDGTLLPGADGATHVITSAGAGDVGIYTVEVSNLCATTLSQGAAVDLLAETSVTADPVGVQQCEGTTATLSVGAAGAGLTYQWLFNGSVVVGATAADLVLTPLTVAHAGDYTVQVTGSCGSTTSAVATVGVDLLPAIDVPPLSQGTTVGASLSLDVQASGLAPLSYQWFKDAAPLAGETAAMLLIDPVVSSSAGAYSVAVTNPCGTTTSSDAIVGVDQVPGPAGVTCCTSDLDAQLCWTLPTTYSAIEVRRDGVLVATLAGDAVCHDELLPGAGVYAFELTGMSFGESSLSTFCAIEAFVPVSSLQCTIPMPAPGLQDVLVSWTNSLVYSGFAIYRDDVLVSTLPGGSTTFLDVGVPDGFPQYRVEAQQPAVGCASSAASTCAVLVSAPVGFRRGDANNDLQFNVADVVFVITYLFNSGASPLCFDAADINDDGFLDISDAIFMLLFSFSGGPPPPAPFSETAVDPTPDGLGCAASAW